MGILLAGLTVEDMKQGTSRIRNPIIARVFRELDLVEQWGTGVRRIFDEAREMGLPEPKIEEVGMRVRFTVYLAEEHRIQNQPSEETNKSLSLKPKAQITTQDTEQVTAQVTAQVTEQVAEQVTEQVARLIIALGDRTISGQELMEAVGLQHRPTFLYSYLHPSLSKGVIEMTLPNKPRSSKQRYRLTVKGFKFLDELEKQL